MNDQDQIEIAELADAVANIKEGENYDLVSRASSKDLRLALFHAYGTSSHEERQRKTERIRIFLEHREREEAETRLRNENRTIGFRQAGIAFVAAVLGGLFTLAGSIWVSTMDRSTNECKAIAEYVAGDREFEDDSRHEWLLSIHLQSQLDRELTYGEAYYACIELFK